MVVLVMIAGSQVVQAIPTLESALRSTDSFIARESDRLNPEGIDQNLMGEIDDLFDDEGRAHRLPERISARGDEHRRLEHLASSARSLRSVLAVHWQSLQSRDSNDRQLFEINRRTLLLDHMIAELDRSMVTLVNDSFRDAEPRTLDLSSFTSGIADTGVVLPVYDHVVAIEEARAAYQRRLDRAAREGRPARPWFAGEAR